MHRRLDAPAQPPILGQAPSPVCYLHAMAGSPAAGAEGPGVGPLERIASFRFAYLAIFVFLVAYVFTVEALEEVLRRYYRAGVEAAVQVDPAAGPVAGQIGANIDAFLQGSPWIRYGEVRVRPLVLAADGRTLLYAGGGLANRAPGAELAEEPPLPAIVDVDVALPHNTVLANAVLLAYAALLVTALVVHTRRLAARQQLELDAMDATRDALAERAGAIEAELTAVRSRLGEVEPESELQAEEIGELQRERAELHARLARLERREAELRSGTARAQKLEEERRALEELLEEATRDLDRKESELSELRGQTRRAGKRAARDEEVVARRLRTLYKNLEVDERAIENLVELGDESWRLRAEEAIKRLCDEADSAAVRRKVGGLPPHLSIFELGFADKGRIYYTSGQTRRFRVLLIGAKNSQKADLEYLSRLPKGT
jgi:predicted  nucleic acid-binding Zn-ribbon protein